MLDAHGIQLLTGRHLDRAGDLGGWDIREVAPDRYLVEAADLEPWFGQDAPNQEVLESARNDFGDMVITWEHVTAEPGPYTKPRPQPR